MINNVRQKLFNLFLKCLTSGRQLINHIFGKNTELSKTQPKDRVSIQKELSDIMKAELNFEDKRDDYGRTLLHYAAKCDRVDMVYKLVALGEECDPQDRFGLTPLHLAVENKNESVVRALIALGANTEAQDYMQVTPLHWATLNGNENVVRVLIELGANIKVQCKKGRTLLDAAHDNLPLVQLFIRLGVNPNTPDNLGNLPTLGLSLDASRKQRIHLIVTVLLEGQAASEDIKRRLALMSEAEINRALDPRSYEQFCADVCCPGWVMMPDSQVRSLTWMSSKDMVKHHPQRCTNLLADWNEPMSRAVNFQKAANAKKAAEEAVNKCAVKP